MVDDLKEKATRGLFWGALNSGTTQVLQLLIGILLGRILSPGEYGILVYVAIFTAIAGNLQSSGFSTYLINMKAPRHEDYNAVFWFNVLTSFALYAILFACSPLIADFFHQPILTKVSHYVFLTFVLASFGIVPNAYMARRLMIKEGAIMNTAALVVSGATAIAMALAGCSFWSLIVQQILYILVLNIGRYYYIDWRPTMHIDLRPIRKMFAFSVNILVTMIMNTVSTNIMSFILGKLFNKDILGNYGQAYKWDTMAYSLVTNTLSQVAQPVFASIANEREREQKVFRKILRFTAFLSFPAMFGLAMVAREFILVTIGPKWMDSILMLQILCIGGAFFPFYSVYQNLAIGRGRSDINMWCNILQIIIQIALLLLCYRWGIIGMVAVYSAFNIVWLLAWQTQIHRLIGLRLWDVLKDIVPFMVIALAVMALTGWLTAGIASNLVLLLTRVAVAGVLYVGIMKLARVQILDECIAFVMKKFNKH